MRQLQPRDHSVVQASRQTAALFGRDDLQALVVTGRDRLKFLHNMLTQDVHALASGGTALACLCDAQGAVLATMRLVVAEDRIVAWVPRRQVAALQETLDKFIIADDVELTLDDDLACLELVGPLTQDFESKALIAAPSAVTWSAEAGGGELSPWGPAQPAHWIQLPRDLMGDVAGALIDAGATAGSHAAREALRIAEGSAVLGDDIDDGSLPIEFGLHAAVSFKKGCYVGQEAIAMMTYRGQIRRHLCWVVSAGPPWPDAGWQLRTIDGKRAGRMGSSVRDADGRWLGLAMVQRKAYVRGGELVAIDGERSCPITVVSATVAGVLDPKVAAAEAS